MNLIPTPTPSVIVEIGTVAPDVQLAATGADYALVLGIAIAIVALGLFALWARGHQKPRK